MENNKLYINAIIMVFLLAGCYSKKNVYIETSEVDEPQQIINFDKWDSIHIDSIYKFVCQGKEFNIKGNTISRPYFDTNLRNCLLEMGYNGDKEANIQLAKLISMVGLNEMLIFGNGPKFRGPEVFKAFLSLDRDYSIIEHIDTETDNVDMSVVDAQSNLRYLAIMLESIYGMSWKDFTADLINYEYKTPQHLPNGKENKHRFAEEIKVMLEAIDQAWAEGKIVLKPYGVK